MKKTRTITLDELHNKKAKIIEAIRSLGSRSAVITFLIDKEITENPKLYVGLGKETN